MGEVLVLVEQSDGSVKKVTSELLTLARRLGEPSAVWVGPGISDAAVATLGEFGATTVYVAGDEALAKHPVAPKAEVLAQLVAEKAPTAVLIASTADGKEAAGRLAVRTDSGVITDAVDIDASLTATQSVFGGSTVVHSKVTSGHPDLHRPRQLGRPGGSTRHAGPRRRRRDPLRCRHEGHRHRPHRRGEGRSPGADGGRDRGLRRPWRGRRGGLRRDRGPGGLPRCGRGRVPRGDGRRLVPAPVPGGPDRQDGLARSCTSRTGSPARSSTGPGCRRRRRSSWSTRIPRRRSSSSPTTASSATCSRSCRS